ncbi:MAG: hypothetical protein QG622_2522 [Actinomycetota bacterium]|nr:hypothetical protein [Actinomycetota bacterium]
MIVWTLAGMASATGAADVAPRLPGEHHADAGTPRSPGTRGALRNGAPA